MNVLPTPILLRRLALFLGQLSRVNPLDFSTAAEAAILPLDVPVEEERRQHYDPKQFYPVKLGEVFHGTYEIAVKVGFGGNSTVWLARNLMRFKQRYAIVKICTNSPDRAEEARHELELSRHIAAAKPGHPGLEYVRLVQDSFEILGPSGPHLCLVYKPMREPLWLLQRRMPGGVFPMKLLGFVLKFLLTGLSYLHNECNVIHTDLKPENVLVGLEKTLSLEDVVADEINSPSPRKILPDRTIYLSRNDFGRPKLSPGRPKIADFDAAVRVTGSQKTFTHPIQPNCYRAPEAILGAPWSYPVDIWNLGTMLWDLVEGRAHRGEYTSHAHLAQLIGLLGPPPKELLARGTQTGIHFAADGEFLGRAGRGVLPIPPIRTSYERWHCQCLSGPVSYPMLSPAASLPALGRTRAIPHASCGHPLRHLLRFASFREALI